MEEPRANLVERGRAVGQRAIAGQRVDEPDRLFEAGGRLQSAARTLVGALDRDARERTVA